MAVSKELIEAVESNDILGVRLILKNSLILDPSGNSFSEMLEYTSSKISDLFVTHDGELFKDKNEWNKDYYNEQTVKVVNNFSVERVELLKNMAKMLFDNSNEVKKDIIYTSDDYKQDGRIKGESVSKIKIAGGIVAAVGAGTIIYGIVAEAPIIVPVIGGAAIVAGAFMIIKK